MGKGDVIKIRRADLPKVNPGNVLSGPSLRVVDERGDGTIIEVRDRMTPAFLRVKARAYLALAEHVEVRDREKVKREIDTLRDGLVKAGIGYVGAELIALRLHEQGWKAP